MRRSQIRNVVDVWL